jgi:hypothetical protein
MPNDRHHGLLQRLASVRDFFTDDRTGDRTPSGALPDYADGSSIEAPTPRPRRRPIYTAGRVYTDAERRKLHQAVDVCIDRQARRKARAADGWTEDLHRDATATERFGTSMLADDDLAARYVANSQARWPSQCNFTSNLPLAFTPEAAKRLAPIWKAAAAKRREE